MLNNAHTDDKSNLGLYQRHTSTQFYYRINWYRKMFGFKVWSIKCGGANCGAQIMRCKLWGGGEAEFWGAQCGSKVWGAKWVNTSIISSKLKKMGIFVQL